MASQDHLSHAQGSSFRLGERIGDPMRRGKGRIAGNRVLRMNEGMERIARRYGWLLREGKEVGREEA